ncbi:hypothetical protein HELRODRAFT_93614 [Helobdella robusta]|uniref:Mitochondrial inner membrane protease subunit 2 n=1 Tax=Helobdella robusta TaxID=6412 RepID=T1G8W9_HELRO|nr:hypothetical protein HELRODRAFT_93614 [Helobdella robusta]ESO13038.1 hypothetical protein HELRODRAFT_93614 [Helobdella robusta]
MLKSVIKVVAFTVPATLTLFDTCGYVCRVEGSSMRPLINDSYKEINYVFLNRWNHRNYDFVRGEVVCLTCPSDPKQKILKRIIALEGDIVRTINYKEKHITVPKGYCWVEGDNHKQSLDSNIFGPVPLGLINSKATHVVWPLNRIQSIPVTDVSQRIKNYRRLECVAQTGFYVSKEQQSVNSFVPQVETQRFEQTRSYKQQ